MLRLGDLWTSLTGVAELTSRVEPRRRTSAWLLLDIWNFRTENLNSAHILRNILNQSKVLALTTSFTDASIIHI